MLFSLLLVFQSFRLLSQVPGYILDFSSFGVVLSSRLLAGLTKPESCSGRVSPDCFRSCPPSCSGFFPFLLVSILDLFRIPSSMFQIGNVLQYCLILDFAVPMVIASVISGGALFHSLPVSLTKLFSAILFFPPSIILLLVDGLTVLSVSLSSSPSAFLNFIG